MDGEIEAARKCSPFYICYTFRDGYGLQFFTLLKSPTPYGYNTIGDCNIFNGTVKDLEAFTIKEKEELVPEQEIEE